MNNIDLLHTISLVLKDAFSDAASKVQAHAPFVSAALRESAFTAETALMVQIVEEREAIFDGRSAIAIAINAHRRAEDMEELDFAYSPPHPFLTDEEKAERRGLFLNCARTFRYSKFMREALRYSEVHIGGGRWLVYDAEKGAMKLQDRDLTGPYRTEISCESVHSMWHNVSSSVHALYEDFCTSMPEFTHEWFAEHVMKRFLDFNKMEPMQSVPASDLLREVFDFEYGRLNREEASPAAVMYGNYLITLTVDTPDGLITVSLRGAREYAPEHMRAPSISTEEQDYRKRRWLGSDPVDGAQRSYSLEWERFSYASQLAIIEALKNY